MSLMVVKVSMAGKELSDTKICFVFACSLVLAMMCEHGVRGERRFS